jgi:hypothetical protein
VTIGLIGDAEDGGRTRQILELARALGAVRDAEVEAGPTARLLEAIEAIRAELGDPPTPRCRSGWGGTG